MRYILELVDKDMFVEHLCTTYPEKTWDPTTYTMNALKAEVFDTEDISIEDISWLQEDVKEKHCTLVKVVQLL